jgi:hypothetical protein
MSAAIRSLRSVALRIHDVAAVSPETVDAAAALARAVEVFDAGVTDDATLAIATLDEAISACTKAVDTADHRRSLQ